MIASWLRVAGVAIAFLLVFITGFWLTRSGKPYRAASLTVHKLAAVGILVLLGVCIYQANRTPAVNVLAWLVISLAFVGLAAMIVSGSVLSIVESPLPAISILHKVAPYPTLLLTVAALYCLLSRIGQ